MRLVFIHICALKKLQLDANSALFRNRTRDTPTRNANMLNSRSVSLRWMNSGRQREVLEAIEPPRLYFHSAHLCSGITQTFLVVGGSKSLLYILERREWWEENPLALPMKEQKVWRFGICFNEASVPSVMNNRPVCLHTSDDDMIKS